MGCSVRTPKVSCLQVQLTPTKRVNCIGRYASESNKLDVTQVICIGRYASESNKLDVMQVIALDVMPVVGLDVMQAFGLDVMHTPHTYVRTYVHQARRLLS